MKRGGEERTRPIWNDLGNQVLLLDKQDISMTGKPRIGILYIIRQKQCKCFMQIVNIFQCVGNNAKCLLCPVIIMHQKDKLDIDKEVKKQLTQD